MNRLTRMLSTVLVAGLAGAGASGVGAQTLTVDPGAYQGAWTVNYGPAHRGAQTLQLGTPGGPRGDHVLSLGGAELNFQVSRAGEVVVRNAAAAGGGPGRLALRTVPVQVNPAYFTGSWRIAHGVTEDFTGVQVVALVPGLSYYSLSVGSTGGFYFHLAGDGTVTVENQLAATGGVGRLRLNNTRRFVRSSSD